MAWFVLNPPPGVRVVSFFITARWAGQDNWVAFTDVVLEQLAELLDGHLPPFLTEATRGAHLHRMLADAAGRCADRGERLVLLVDGLDEDRGVTTGPDAHSIAALLPVRPAAGLRVIVAGRPNPPIPTDVPEHHPLRDARIIRPLAPSEYARVVRGDMERELKRLLAGTPAEQDLLGLLTAAGGGLSGPDLAELTGWSVWQVEDHLRTVAGRSFTSRSSHWRPDAAPQVYVLGHEEVQRQAVNMLGADRLAGYRQRLHTWADRYQAQGWPVDTPQYLLRGYYRMLHAVGDLERMVACATDPARHDRMLDLSGGDSTALAEITTAHTLIGTQPSPDLLAALRLAWYRDQLADRNTNIPTELPAIWATLRQPIRAEALARSITDPNLQARALAGLAQAVAATGDHDHAEQIAHSITDPNLQARALADLAQAVAATGDHDRARALATHAEQIARSITDPNLQAWALAGLARAVAATGDHDHAEQIAHSITRPNLQAQALTDLAQAVAATGDHDHAEQIAHSITRPNLQAQALTDLAQAVAATGDHDRARALATDAEQIARSITDPNQQARALAGLARAVAATGDHDRARALATDAEQIVRSITDPDQQAWALAGLARAVAATGDHDHAEQIAHSITRPNLQAQALTDLAQAVAATGDHDRARALATHAEQIARSITDPDQQAWALAGLARAVAATGDHDHAEQIAHSITRPNLQ
ncbi:tetratricopeptide repeat protein, partial [Micromonospora sp. S-DT3-3-22]|uniref:tetratricopeptide repeat protein n=1 Tax=Micromonospora sp. S-DT3-3-22 TaxID=2755359 RepID=UPI00188DE3A9